MKNKKSLMIVKVTFLKNNFLKSEEKQPNAEAGELVLESKNIGLNVLLWLGLQCVLQVINFSKPHHHCVQKMNHTVFFVNTSVENERIPIQLVWKKGGIFCLTKEMSMDRDGSTIEEEICLQLSGLWYCVLASFSGWLSPNRSRLSSLQNL